MRILIVEDDPQLGEALARGLGALGFAVDWFGDGSRADGALATTPYDAIVLDLGLPGRDGLHWLTRWRSGAQRVPVLILTARDAVEQRIEGLDAGADDYLVKPFALEELGARLRALLRRTGGPIEDTLRYADIALDPAGHTVHRGARRLELTRTEFLLLELLMNHPRQVLTRTQIFEGVWGYDFGPSSNSLEVYVGYLRRKLGEPRLIQTVRGVGYVLREQ